MIEVIDRKPTADALAERIRAACMIIRAKRYTDQTDRLVLAILEGKEYDVERDGKTDT